MEIGPPVKKLKHSDSYCEISTDIFDRYIQLIDNKKNLKAVLSDEFDSPLKLVKVFVGHIKDVKNISKTILALNQKIPLKELQHLKRVRRQDVILCPTNFFNDTSSIQDFIECYVPELKDMFEYFKQVEVPLNPPKIDRHFQETKRIWSCNFHPNKYLEKLTGDEFFPPYDLKNHRLFMKVVFEVAKFYSIKYNIDSIDSTFKNINATIVVDPNLQTIVALSFDNRQAHPVQHSAMLAIDNVAKTQDGGVWNSKENNNEYVGVPEDVLPYLKEKFPSLKYYQKEYKNDLEDKIKSKEGPYLCTGYYIYMLREPCVMCSMALVHSRVQRVFFCVGNDECGALKSKTKLQTIASLNHHFEVFTDFL
nr:probable inactive tRNA-specific adenosine deaminase-like protein 3 [Vanessa tameamea]